MKSFSAVLLGCLAIASTACAEPSTYTLLHRVSSPTEAGSWSVRGQISLDETAASTVVNGTASSPHSFTSSLTKSEVQSLWEQASSAEAKEQTYQVALSTSSSFSDELPSTSIPLCHLRQSHASLPTLDDQITIRARKGSQTSTIVPYALSYRVLDIKLGSDGCPVPSNDKYKKVQEEAKKQRQREAARRSRRRNKDGTSAKANSASAPSDASSTTIDFNTHLQVLEAQKPFTPPLQAALPTKEDGTVQEPEPEKTFLQKYWFYLIPIAVLFVMSATEEDPAKQGAESHPSSQHAGSGMGAKKLK